MEKALNMSQQVLNSYASKVFTKEQNRRSLLREEQYRQVNYGSNDQSQVVRIDNGVRESNVYVERVSRDDTGYQKVSNQDLDERFWRVIRDAKQQVLRCETSMSVGNQKAMLK